MNALAYVTSQPWMIVPEYLDIIISIASRERDPETIARGIAEATEKREARETSPAALAMKQGEPLGDNSRVRVRDGVAVLNVIGPIVRHADLFSDISGATSTGSLARDFNAALSSPGVQSILMFIDSPGGEAFGIGEFASMIASRAIDKPVTAYIGGFGASAAYYIAAAADEVVIDPSALVGSIGTVMESTDYTKAYEQRGVTKKTYVSTDSPNKRPKINTESGDAVLQKIVDDMGRIFVEDVARYRGVSVEKVLSDFGRGGLLVGKAAADAGMVDRLGSFEAVLKEMADGKAKRKRKAMYSAEGDNTLPESGDKGEKSMSAKDSFFAWLDSVTGKEPTATAPPQNPPALPNIPQVPAPPAQNASQPAGDSEQVKALQAQLLTEKKARFTAEAEGFINGKIVAKEVLPSAKDAFVRDYVRAALDDEANPVASGEVTRVDALKGHYTGGKPHKLTMELVKSEVKGARLLDNADDPEAAEIEEAQASAKVYAERANGKQKAS